jgi:hypothetical protein
VDVEHLGLEAQWPPGRQIVSNSKASKWLHVLRAIFRKTDECAQCGTDCPALLVAIHPLILCFVSILSRFCSKALSVWAQPFSNRSAKIESMFGGDFTDRQHSVAVS